MQSTWTPSARLRDTCRSLPNGGAWLAQLPDTVRALERRWSLTIDPPYEGDDAACSWVATVVRADGSPAVLKIGVPHFEGEHEIDGLRFWAGDPTVYLLDAAAEHNAMLLERCEPGTSLRAQPETEQDRIIAMLLRRLWRMPGSGHAFRPLSEQMSAWSAEARAVRERSSDIGLVDAGLALFAALPAARCRRADR
jgi:streptomycin 6-kinase